MKTRSIDWFLEAKYGMFYHFGLYTQIGGNENSVRKDFGKTKYREIMNKFNPENFNADQWVDCAVSMGARYIVPTAKHAEGFCLFDSKLTKLKSTNTLFGRDLMAELSDACARKGVTFCFYFNLETWLNEQDDIWNEKGMSYADFFEGQLEELLTNYGPVGMIWFDHQTSEVPFDRMEKIIAKIKILQPNCLVNDRGIPNDADRLIGDFITTERCVPDVDPSKNMVVETCDAMGIKSWGYCKDEAFWSVQELARRVSACSAKGYNYLLNVEPAPDGSIRPECVDRAKGLGDWIRKHDTFLRAAPSSIEPCSNIHQKEPLGISTLSENMLHLHLWEWPISDEVLVKVKTTPVSAVLEDGTHLHIKTDETGVIFTGLPGIAPGANGPWMIDLKFEGELEVLPPEQAPMLELLPGQSVYLAPEGAHIPFGTHFRGMKRIAINSFPDGRSSLGSFHSVGDQVYWKVNSPTCQAFDVYMSLGAMEVQGDADFELSTTISSITGTSWVTGHYSIPQRRHVGKITLDKGINRIKLKVTRTGVRTFADVHGIWLIPT